MAEEGDLRINGKVYDPNTMTFREQREMRRLMRDELFKGEKINEETLGLADTLPAMAVVLVRRDDPAFTIDDALDLVPNDVILTKEEAAALKAPPTKAKKSTSGVSGPAQ